MQLNDLSLAHDQTHHDYLVFVCDSNYLAPFRGPRSCAKHRTRAQCRVYNFENILGVEIAPDRISPPHSSSKGTQQTERKYITWTSDQYLYGMLIHRQPCPHPQPRTLQELLPPRLLPHPRRLHLAHQTQQLRQRLLRHQSLVQQGHHRRFGEQV